MKTMTDQTYPLPDEAPLDWTEEQAVQYAASWGCTGSTPEAALMYSFPPHWLHIKDEDHAEGCLRHLMVCRTFVEENLGLYDDDELDKLDTLAFMIAETDPLP